MIRAIRPFAVLGVALLLPGFAVAQQQGPQEWEEEYDGTSPPPQPQGQPPPPSTAAQPPSTDQAAPPAAGAPADQGTVPPGQWVLTDQYGWVWMPYSDAYTWVPANGYGEPYMYLYYPAYGWLWLSAPWVWGLGPWPFFGFVGAVNFGWYSHGWWRYPNHWTWVHTPFHPWGGRGWNGGWNGGRTFPGRPTPGPYPRTGPAFRGGPHVSPPVYRGGFARPGGVYAPRAGVGSPGGFHVGAPSGFAGGFAAHGGFAGGFRGGGGRH